MDEKRLGVIHSPSLIAARNAGQVNSSFLPGTRTGANAS
jgi:hypothetical protein